MVGDELTQLLSYGDLGYKNLGHNFLLMLHVGCSWTVYSPTDAVLSSFPSLQICFLSVPQSSIFFPASLATTQFFSLCSLLRY